MPGLGWAAAFTRRCRAKGGDGEYYGRCELQRGHSDFHALERGMVVVRFGPSAIYYESCSHGVAL